MADDEEVKKSPTFLSIVRNRAYVLLGVAIYWVFTSRFISWLLLGPETPHIKIGFAFVSIVFLLAFVIYKTVFWIDFGNVKLFIQLYPFLSKLSAVVIVFLVGCTLFFVKRKARLAYGLVETGLALAAGWQAVSRLDQGTFPELFAFVVSIYFAVRGTENSYLGFEELREYLRALAEERYKLLLSYPDLPEPPAGLDAEAVRRTQQVVAIIAGKINKNPSN